LPFYYNFETQQLDRSTRHVATGTWHFPGYKVTALPLITIVTYLNRSHKLCKHFVSLARFCPSPNGDKKEKEKMHASVIVFGLQLFQCVVIE